MNKVRLSAIHANSTIVILLISITSCTAKPVPGNGGNQSSAANKTTTTTQTTSSESGPLSLEGSYTTSESGSFTTKPEDQTVVGKCVFGTYSYNLAAYSKETNRMTFRSIRGIPVLEEIWHCGNPREPLICCPSVPDYIVHVWMGGAEPVPGIYEFGKNGVSAKYFAIFDHKGPIDGGSTCECTRYPTRRNVPIPEGRVEVIENPEDDGRPYAARIVAEPLGKVEFEPISKSTPASSEEFNSILLDHPVLR